MARSRWVAASLIERERSVLGGKHENKFKSDKREGSSPVIFQ